MRREFPRADAQAGKVVHVVGCVTDEVHSFLGPATYALARSGVEQTVVMVDEPRYRHHLVGLHEAAELVLTPSLRNPFKQWHAVLQARHVVFASSPLCAVHLHGLVPGLVGAVAARATSLKAPIFFSPHGSRSLGILRRLGVFALPFLRIGPKSARNAAIVNVSQESSAFEHWGSVELVESPVGEAYFTVARNEARHPLIVTGGSIQSARSVELFAQLAVLLSGEDLRASFNWVGAVDEISRLRLTAAKVGVFDVVSDDDCASRLAAGWVYVAPGATRGVPLFLVQAMAAGVPCVAVASPNHREVIRDGETGCQSEHEMMERIAALIDSPALRTRIGANAREEATHRFGERQFTARLLAAYSLPS